MNLSSRAQVYRTRKAARRPITRPVDASVTRYGGWQLQWSQDFQAELTRIADLSWPSVPAATPYPAPKEQQ